MFFFHHNYVSLHRVTITTNYRLMVVNNAKMKNISEGSWASLLRFPVVLSGAYIISFHYFVWVLIFPAYNDISLIKFNLPV